MKCCFHKCKKNATEFYQIIGVRFGYCKKHSAIPDKIIKNTKIGHYSKHRGKIKGIPDRSWSKFYEV